MIEPDIDSLLEKADSKFTLCIMVGKRARQLIGGAHQLTRADSDQAVSIAINETNENMIKYVRTKSGIK